MKTIRYEKVSEQVFKLMETCDIRSYPVNFRELTQKAAARSLNIEFDTYESFERYFPNARSMFASRDGAAVYFPEAGFYIIFYNSSRQPQSRINWTIAHEIGHILMGHYVQKSSLEYEAEREADHFAKLLLCHPLILEKCGVNSSEEIKKLCGLSDMAAANRERELDRALNGLYFNKWDKLIGELFAEFTSKKKCSACGGITAGGNISFCPYCGGSVFTHGIDALLAKTPKRKMIKCPVCENQDLRDSNFCKICGLNLSNPCKRCLKATDITALFCPYCKGTTELAKARTSLADL